MDDWSAVLSLPSVTTEYVRVAVSATESGVRINPTTSAVSMAFTAATAEPVSGDWKAASWDPVATCSGYLAQCLIGPGGVVALADGEYAVWIRIVHDEENVQRRAGTLTIT